VGALGRLRIAPTVTRYYDPGSERPAREGDERPANQRISVIGSFSFDATIMKASPGRARPSTPTTTEHRQRI
jgi:hypothetical protein